MSDLFDLVVLGVGGIGSAALLSAATRGWKVLGLEQFGAGHDRGSSHGQTRIIRRAYFEHPDYVPLANQAFAHWQQIEETSQVDLFHATGLLQVGHPDSPVIRGVQASALQHQLTVETLTADEIVSRWPVFRIHPGQIGLFEAGAGYLRVEKCVAQMTRLAIAAGAQYRPNSTVLRWKTTAAGDVEIIVNEQTVRAQRLIITAGAWSQEIVSGLNLGLQVLRKQQHWFQVDRHEVHQGNGQCCFLFDTPHGCFYGFPQIDELGVKVAEHSGGTLVEHPSDLNRELDLTELQRTEHFLQSQFEIGRQRLVYSSPCMYTMSPDSHFIVDRIPGCPHVAFAAGLSGHGFKFAPVLGEHLVDLVSGSGNPQCQFFGLQRFGK